MIKKVLFIFFLINIFCLLLTKAQTQLNTLGTYVWQSSDNARVFNGKLQLSFVRANDGFPNYGTVIAGGGYIHNQDGGAFQLYFPYNSKHGGIAPKIRLGSYDNQGWSNWETLFTTANANSSTIDWKVKKLEASDNAIILGKIGIKTDSPRNALDVNGTIRAKEIKVESGWADFVFDENYKLPSLTEVEKHIKENGHLQGIPTEREVKENGVNLGEMNAKLLQKVEELTLYLIEHEKENRAKDACIKQLIKRVNTLEKQIQKRH